MRMASDFGADVGPTGQGTTPVGRVVDAISAVRADCWFLVEFGHLSPAR
jgi:hypothetical protein